MKTQSKWMAGAAAMAMACGLQVHAQGAGSGPEGVGMHREGGAQSGGGLGASGSGPQGSGAQGDHSAGGKDAGSGVSGPAAPAGGTGPSREGGPPPRETPDAGGMQAPAAGQGKPGGIKPNR